jgi:hypothetical protein
MDVPVMLIVFLFSAKCMRDTPLITKDTVGKRDRDQFERDEDQTVDVYNVTNILLDYFLSFNPFSRTRQ